MAANEPVHLGNLVRLKGVFRASATDEPQNPTAVYISIRRPGGKVETFQYGVDSTVGRDSTGRYHYDWSADVAGRTYYRWWSTGTGKAGREKYVDVLPAKAVQHP